MQFKIFSMLMTLLAGLAMMGRTEAGRSSSILRHIASQYAPIESILTSGDLSDMMRILSDATVQELCPTPKVPALAFDAKESNTTYEIIFDLPGVAKKDISLSLKDNELSITASRVTDKDEGVVYRRVERISGEMSRNIVLPDDCEKDKIEAESKDGVLVIKIPKVKSTVEEAATMQIEVK